MNATNREPAPSSFSLQLRIPPLPRYARRARTALRAFGRFHHIAARDLEYLTFALGEALSNAMQHARTHDDIAIGFQVDAKSITATVSDRGQGLADTPIGPAGVTVSESSESGRGFMIMERCTDFFTVHSVPGEGTVVTLGRYRQP
jgi:stage II sporulation protein AB (anti-sigma F factor)